MDLLVVEMGRVTGSLAERCGQFGDWFMAALKKAAPSVKTVVAQVESASHQALADAAGVILSGAVEGVYDHLPWRSRFDNIMEKVLDTNLPVLGVCFSHQYLTAVLGGKVEKRPEGEEFGRHELELTEAGRKDSLFDGIPARFGALESHHDVVVEPAPGCAVLAKSERAAVQAFRWGRNVWGIQFHPEMTSEIAEVCIEDEIEESDTSGHSLKTKALERAKKSLRYPHAGIEVLRNFVGICAGLDNSQGAVATSN